MKREDAEALKARLENEGILQLLNKKADEMFGLKSQFLASVAEDYGKDCFIKLIDATLQATEKLTATKLLSLMFVSAHLVGYTYYFEDDDILEVKFEIEYEHPRGGRNGLTLVRMNVDVLTGEIIQVW